MSWNELSLYVKTLEAGNVNKVYENLEYLRDTAIEKGLSIHSLFPVEARMDTKVEDVGRILQDVEDDLRIINQVVESIYYEQWHLIFRTFSLEDYQRWVLCLNDLYDIIVNDKGKWGVLQLSDGYPTIGNKKIIIRGESIGN